MKRRRLCFGIIALAGLVTGGSLAWGQTIIIDPMPIPPRPHPRPHPRPWPRPVIPPPPPRNMPLEVRKHLVDVSIIDGVAVTGVEQVFFNPHDRTVEGTYIFPLEDDVSLGKFSMFVNGREIEGKLLTVEEARRTYESIVSRMRDPALLEYLGTRMFRARIFPINPKSEVRVRLSYTQTLCADAGLVRYRYPLNTEKHLASPIENVSLLVNLESKTPVKTVFSPSHRIAVSRPSDHKASASYEGKQVYPDKDFDLYYALADAEFGLTVLTHRQTGEDGFFLARIAPPTTIKEGDVLAKDITFVIDTSGSMAGDKMVQAREALKFCLANLNPGDNFNIVSFAHEAIKFRPALVPASPENVTQGRKFADELRATGGTNINDALLTALSSGPAHDGDRPYLIVFLTDGQPTIGVTEPEEILRHVQGANTDRIRLFVFGVGHDVNTHLLDLLAEQNRGARDYVEPGEDLELKLSSFYRKVSKPVLADIALSFGDLNVYDTYPPKLGDLFSGTELVVVGRYRGEGSKAVELTGSRRGRAERFVYETNFPYAQSSHDFLPRLWATRKVGFLLDEMRLHGENKELKDTIVTLATEYGIVTPYTAYLVTEPGQVAWRADRGNVLADAVHEMHRSYRPLKRRKGPPVPQDPAGYRGGTSSGGDWARSIVGQADGAEAVRASKDVADMRGADTDTASFRKYSGSVLSPGSRGGDAATAEVKRQAVVKRVGTRTFYHVDDRWVDAAYDKRIETTKVELFSEEYFKLVREHPDLAKCFALGERVIVMVDGNAYETVPPPPPGEK